MKIKHFVSVFVLGILIHSILAQQRPEQPVTLEKVDGNIYRVLGGRGSIGGAFVGETGVLLIDIKMTKESVDQLIEELAKITDKPVTHLISTHSDGDHIAGNKFLPKSVLFIAHENCRREFFHPRRNGEPSEWNDPALLPYVPSLTFREKMDVYLGRDKVELWYFGVGHTTGDAVVYFPQEKVAFIGDQIFTGRPQLIHSYKGGNSFEHVKTLSKMLETLEVRTYCTGHSDPFGPETVRDHIQKMKAMQDKVAALVSKGESKEKIQSAFEENEARLVESIYNEISMNSRQGGQNVEQ